MHNVPAVCTAVDEVIVVESTARKVQNMHPGYLGYRICRICGYVPYGNSPFLTQLYIECKRLATKEEIDELAASKGFRDNREGEGVNYISDRLYLEDMHPANVFIDALTNKPICIDCIVKFINKD